MGLVRSFARELLRDFQHRSQTSASPGHSKRPGKGKTSFPSHILVASPPASSSDCEGRPVPQEVQAELDLDEQDGMDLAWLDSLDPFAMLGNQEMSLDPGDFLEYLLDEPAKDGQSDSGYGSVSRNGERSWSQSDHGLDS